jgi:hypothetical protein
LKGKKVLELGAAGGELIAPSPAKFGTDLTMRHLMQLCPESSRPSLELRL